MSKPRLLFGALCFAAITSPAWAQQAPAHMQIDISTVRAPVASTADQHPVPMSVAQQPMFSGQALEPIKAEIADIRARMASIDGRENQRNGATIDALTALNSSSTSQRGALADIQATLDRIETRLKKLEARAPH